MKLIIKFTILLFTLAFIACEECEEFTPTSCGGSASNPMIDIIVLIDASGSMAGAASSVSQAAKIFETGNDTCPADLSVKYFGVEGTFLETVFDQNHRNYLDAIVPTGTIFAGDSGHVGLRSEQGGNAISDLSNYMDWREGACKAILYISDEELDSVSPPGDYTNEDEVTAQAILDAKSNNVAVFTHHLTYQNRGPEILQNYMDLSVETGGIHVNTESQSVSVEFYEALLPNVLCNSCNACKLNDLLK